MGYLTKTRLTTNQQRVSIINEALPYIRQFTGKTFVIKYGGASMTNPLLKQKVIEDIALLHYVGVRPVVVHGGGPEINVMLDKLHIKAEFKNGLRVTDKATMEIVEMVLVGKVQKELVGLLNQAGAKAVGLSGKDGALLKAKKINDKDFDWQCTGDIESVSTDILEIMTANAYIPVISSVAPDGNGQNYNVNADTVAAELAISLKAEKLILLTDTPGILKDKENPQSLIKKLNPKSAYELIETGVIQGGMIPKVKSAIESVNKGVNSVHILNGTHEHVVLLETFTEEGVGTMIAKGI